MVTTSPLFDVMRRVVMRTPFITICPWETVASPHARVGADAGTVRDAVRAFEHPMERYSRIELLSALSSHNSKVGARKGRRYKAHALFSKSCLGRNPRRRVAVASSTVLPRGRISGSGVCSNIPAPRRFAILFFDLMGNI